MQEQKCLQKCRWWQCLDLSGSCLVLTGTYLSVLIHQTNIQGCQFRLQPFILQIFQTSLHSYSVYASLIWPPIARLPLLLSLCTRILLTSFIFPRETLDQLPLLWTKRLYKSVWHWYSWVVNALLECPGEMNPGGWGTSSPLYLPCVWPSEPHLLETPLLDWVFVWKTANPRDRWQPLFLIRSGTLMLFWDA